MQYDSLAKAIIYGSSADVNLALASESVNELDEYGFTPLIEAVMFGKVEIVKLLLKHGADPNFVSTTGHSALHWAVEVGNLELCKLLLQHKADPNAYTRSSQPVLTLPLLREQKALKQLLYQYHASEIFAKDFILAKLLAHRYELVGPVDIVDTEEQFVQLDMEGFFLEFTLSIVRNSLIRFQNNFAGRHLRPYFAYFKTIIETLQCASELIHYQHFSIDYKMFNQEIDKLLESKLLLLPVGYEGHAITFVVYGDILVKCDRGEWGRENGSIVVYRMNYPQRFTKEFVKALLYTKQSQDTILVQLPQYLGLSAITQIPMAVQLSGNCSWANTEASVLVMLFILQMSHYQNISPDVVIQTKHNSIMIYRQWLLWDKHTSLSEFVQDIPSENTPRKAAKLMQLAAIVFQKLKATRKSDIKLAENLLPLLLQKEYRYILESYKKYFYLDKRTALGDNLMKLIDNAGYYL